MRLVVQMLCCVGRRWRTLRMECWGHEGHLPALGPRLPPALAMDRLLPEFPTHTVLPLESVPFTMVIVNDDPLKEVG
jgi:hypothetical protein